MCGRGSHDDKITLACVLYTGLFNINIDYTRLHYTQPIATCMVMGEVTSCLHLNTQMGPSESLGLSIPQLIVAGDDITTTPAGECVMAVGIMHTPWTHGTCQTTRGVKAQPPLELP